MYTVSAKRKYFIQVLCLCLVSALVYHSWTQDTAPKASDSGKPSKNPTAALTTSYQDKAFLIESQIILFAVHSLRERGQKAQEALFSSLAQSVKQLHSPLDPNPQGVTDLQRQKLIFSDWLGLEKEKEQFCEHIEAQQAEDSEIDEILLTRCSGKQQTLTEEQLQNTEVKLGWFGKLFRSMASDDSNYFAQHVFLSAKERLYSFAKIIFFAGGGLLLSFICLIVIISKLARKKFNFHFRKSDIEEAYLLEIFALYLLAMLVLPLVLSSATKIGMPLNILQANVFAISGLALLAFWPLLFAVKRQQLEEALGLAKTSFTKAVRDFFAGPFTYFSALSGLLMVMMVYAVVLTLLGVDPSGGAHPVVPILSQTKSSTTIYYIFILAVIVAPFVEEVMFRGALYSWLRTRLGATGSIILSSVVFAAVHPQGALGLLPLTCIGMVLAFLREWRGTLLSSILAHSCFNAGTLLLAMNVLR